MMSHLRRTHLTCDTVLFISPITHTFYCPACLTLAPGHLVMCSRLSSVDFRTYVSLLNLPVPDQPVLIKCFIFCYLVPDSPQSWIFSSLQTDQGATAVAQGRDCCGRLGN